jgi:hypothetical protein
MKRGVVTLVVALTAAVLGGCTGEVVVQAQQQQEGGAATPIGNLAIRALPYDRDAIFDSLRAAFTQPEPEIPPTLLALQDSIAAAATQYSTLENRWGTARDSLKKLSDALRTMSRASPTYRVMFRDFGDQETVEGQAKRQMDAAFARYTDLQNRFASTANEVKLQRDQWADEAYVSVDTVVEFKLEELGREEYADTTDANGVGRFQGLKPGQWWIHARYELPFEELYWNVPVDVRRGDPIVIELNRSTAQVRPKL